MLEKKLKTAGVTSPEKEESLHFLWGNAHGRRDRFRIQREMVRYRSRNGLFEGEMV